MISGGSTSKQMFCPMHDVTMIAGAHVGVGVRGASGSIHHEQLLQGEAQTGSQGFDLGAKRAVWQRLVLGTRHKHHVRVHRCCLISQQTSKTIGFQGLVEQKVPLERRSSTDAILRISTYFFVAWIKHQDAGTRILSERSGSQTDSALSQHYTYNKSTLQNSLGRGFEGGISYGPMG